MFFCSQDLETFVLTFWVEKRLDENDQVNFKIHDVTTWKKQLQYTYYQISQEIKAVR